MRKATIGALLLFVLALGVAPGSASAGGKKLVEGTVYDTTCATVCPPECPPPCGPVPAPKSQGAVICAQASIVCPLYRVAPTGSIYTGEGSLVNVRKRGSTTVIARLPIVEGHFTIRLAPGEYIFHPYMAEEGCWSAETVQAKVTAKAKSPVGVAMSATDRCAAHPL
jgi:hypothetical protein